MIKGYPTKIVMKLCGLSARQLGYWDQQGVVKPTISAAAGFGSRRQYSFKDVVQLRMARELKNQGVSLQKIRKSVQYLRSVYPAKTAHLAELRLITDGKTIFVLEPMKKLLDTLKNQYVSLTVIPIGKIIEDTRHEIVKMEKPTTHRIEVHGKYYKIILHVSEEDGGYWCECPELPGCVTQGETEQETLVMVRDAIEGYLEVQQSRPRTKAGRAA